MKQANHTAGHAIRIVLFMLAVIALQSCKENTLTPEMFGSISGTVIDGETNQPIAGASITTTPPTSAIITNDQGEFTISDLPVGEYSVSASKSGYDKAVVSVAVKEGATTTASIFLTEDEVTGEPPAKPVAKFPPDDTTGVTNSLTLVWNAVKSPTRGTIFYDVYLYESSVSAPVLLVEGTKDTTVMLQHLKYETTYFWQVVVRDSGFVVTNGDVWNFTTRGFPQYLLTFADYSGGNFDIFLADTVAGGERIQLTNSASRDWWPRFNPRGDRIAFVSDRNVGKYLYIMKPDGSDLRQLTTTEVAGYHGNGSGWCWSHDGGFLLFSNYNQILRVNELGYGLAKVANGPAGLHFGDLDMNPAGDKIVAQLTGQEAYSSQIYLMNADGGGQTVLVGDEPGATGSPRFTLDGRRVVFTHDASGVDDPTGKRLDSRIYAINTDGTNREDLSFQKPPGTNDTNPRITADGAHILFNNSPVDRPDKTEVWIMSLDGNGRRIIYGSGLGPDWR